MNNSTMMKKAAISAVLSGLLASMTPEEKFHAEANAQRPERKQPETSFVNPDRDLPRAQQLIARRFRQRSAAATYRTYRVLGENSKYMPAGPRKNLKPHNR